jgi:hypothetical protein
MSPEKKNAQTEKSRIMMKRKRQFETEEQTATARSKNRVAIKRKRQFKTEEQTATSR